MKTILSVMLRHATPLSLFRVFFSLSFPPSSLLPSVSFSPPHKCCIFFCLLIHGVGILCTSALAVVISLGLVACVLLCQQRQIDYLSLTRTLSVLYSDARSPTPLFPPSLLPSFFPFILFFPSSHPPAFLFITIPCV